MEGLETLDGRRDVGQNNNHFGCPIEEKVSDLGGLEGLEMHGFSGLRGLEGLEGYQK